MRKPICFLTNKMLTEKPSFKLLMSIKKLRIKIRISLHLKKLLDIFKYFFFLFQINYIQIVHVYNLVVIIIVYKGVFESKYEIRIQKPFVLTPFFSYYKICNFEPIQL